MDIIFTEEAINSIAKIKQVRQIENICKQWLRKAATSIYVYEQSNYLIDLKLLNSQSTNKQTKIGY